MQGLTDENIVEQIRQDIKRNTLSTDDDGSPSPINNTPSAETEGSDDVSFMSAFDCLSVCMYV